MQDLLEKLQQFTSEEDVSAAQLKSFTALRDAADKLLAQGKHTQWPFETQRDVDTRVKEINGFIGRVRTTRINLNEQIEEY